MIEHSELPREKIVAEAMQMVCDEGSAGVTIRTLARRLGLAPATIYSHFRNKEELLRQVAAQGFDQLVEATRGAAQLPDVQQAMAEGGRRYLDFALAHPALYRLMFDETDFAKGGGDATVLGVGRALFELYRDLYARGVASGAIRAIDPELQALISWSAIHGFAMLALAGRMPPPRMPSADRDAIRDAFIGFMGEALRP